MKFDNIGLEGLTLDVERLEDILKEQHLILAGQWDYERVTFDRKFEIKGDTYYLRVLAVATNESDFGKRHAVAKLLTPLLGKHYYPHGVEYGEGEKFPSTLVDQCKTILTNVKAAIEAAQ